jgi:hypothetical protein
MRSYSLVLFLFLLSFTASAQGEKLLLRQGPLYTHKQKINVFPYLAGNATTAKLISTADSLCHLSSRKFQPHIFFLLSSVDTTRMTSSVQVREHWFREKTFDMLEFHPNGNWKIMEQYNAKRQLNGTYAEAYPNALLKVRGKYRDGQKDKTWYYYNESGEIVRKDLYNNGILVSSRTTGIMQSKLSVRGAEPYPYTIVDLKGKH